jgi:hypothetical protein
MSTTFDPKFVPSAKALAIVQLTVADLKSNESILEMLVATEGKIDLLHAQQSVGIYVLKQRGWSNGNLAAKTNYSERTIVRKYIEGMAVLRTGETTRTIAAVRAAELTQKTVEECTKGTGDSVSKIESLERSAVGKALLGSFTTMEGKIPDSVLINKVITETANVVAAQAEPATAGTFIDAIPQVTEMLGLKIKKRATDPDGGANTPHSVDFHLKAALKDAKAIATASNEDYVASATDVKALLALCAYLSLELLIDESVAKAVEALA